MSDAGEPRYQPKQQPSFEQLLGESDVAKIVSQFLSGAATQQEPADRHGTSLSTIRRLLRKREARPYVMGQKRRHKRRRPA